MTRDGTSAVIKQTNDGPGRAELGLLEMLHVVAKDHKIQEKTRTNYYSQNRL